jgi:hypothetical protein
LNIWREGDNEKETDLISVNDALIMSFTVRIANDFYPGRHVFASRRLPKQPPGMP